MVNNMVGNEGGFQDIKRLIFLVEFLIEFLWRVAFKLT